MKVLLAVSGGIDSMYMLHRAPELFPGASFAVAHCNFSLRGEESDGDEAFVRDACDALGIECFVKRFDTPGYAAANGVSVEMAARELRYAWFAALCSEHGFDTLATAHNANDNAETLFLNLLRGSGTKGLRGMEASRDLWSPTTIPLHPQGTGGVPPEVPAAKRPDLAIIPLHPQGTGGVPPETPWVGPAGLRNVMILRPLLGTTREEIRRWMEEKGFAWREDRTNSENEARRNKIRNQVFPIFAEINPSFIRTLGEDMQRIRQTDDIAEDYFREAEARIVKRAPGIAEGAILEINVPGLLALKHWRYVLWRIVEDCSFSAETFDKLCTLLERYRTEPSGTVTLSGKKFESSSYRLSARRKTLILSERNPEA